MPDALEYPIRFRPVVRVQVQLRCTEPPKNDNHPKQGADRQQMEADPDIVDSGRRAIGQKTFCDHGKVVGDVRRGNFLGSSGSMLDRSAFQKASFVSRRIGHGEGSEPNGECGEENLEHVGF